jgi:acyl carrier protein
LWQHAQALAQLRGIVAEVTGSSSVGDEEPLMAAGLDSLAVVELRARVEAAFGVTLPATVALDYPTLKVSMPPAAFGALRCRGRDIYSSRTWTRSGADCVVLRA